MELKFGLFRRQQLALSPHIPRPITQDATKEFSTRVFWDGVDKDNTSRQAFVIHLTVRDILMG